MRNKFHGINCDGCSVAFDGDPMDRIGINDELAGKVSFDPKKVEEITWFWLCGECEPFYPEGPKDFFIPEYWDNIPVCAECGFDDVEEIGHVCDYCQSLLESAEN